ncbi:MAG TPA: serine/threonine-protein kinase [Polyangiaceae bacterium]|nr:serine/threonine-protein kinase [Polyangiaceae bacterium]
MTAPHLTMGSATSPGGGEPLPPEARLVKVAGRYSIYGEIAAGGMATVHYGRLRGAAGFARIVALKRLHPHYAKDPSFVAMFTDEARLAARIRHPNVVATLDVVSEDGELFLVMDYVHGETLAKLIARARRAGGFVPPAVAAAIVHGALQGLHAAHEATSEQGEPLHLVHRDVSPQNVLVGADGAARVLDFGIAKAAGRAHTTQDGVVKGKVGYMPPEQLYGDPLDRRTDVYAAGIVLWEALVGERLFKGDGGEPALAQALRAPVEAPSGRVGGISRELDEVVLRAVERERSARFSTALEMARALEAAIKLAPQSEVAAWVAGCAREPLEARARLIALLEQQRDSLPPFAADQGRATGPGSAPVDGRTIIEPRALTELKTAAPRKKTALPVVLGGVALLGAAALTAVFTLGRGSTESSADARAPAPATAETAGTAGSARSPEISASPSAEPITKTSVGSQLPEVTPAASSSAAASDAAPTASSRAPSTPSKPRATAPAPAPKPAGCDPPYTIDANGHKRYKRECL